MRSWGRDEIGVLMEESPEIFLTLFLLCEVQGNSPNGCLTKYFQYRELRIFHFLYATQPTVMCYSRTQKTNVILKLASFLFSPVVPNSWLLERGIGSKNGSSQAHEKQSGFFGEKRAPDME